MPFWTHWRREPREWLNDTDIGYSVKWAVWRWPWKFYPRQQIQTDATYEWTSGLMPLISIHLFYSYSILTGPTWGEMVKQMIIAANNSRAHVLHNHCAMQLIPRTLQSNRVGHCYHPLGIYASQWQGRGLSCVPFYPQHLWPFLAYSSNSIKYLVDELLSLHFKGGGWGVAKLVTHPSCPALESDRARIHILLTILKHPLIPGAQSPISLPFRSVSLSALFSSDLPFICWNSGPHGWYVEAGPLGGNLVWMRSWGWGPVMGLVPL